MRVEYKLIDEINSTPIRIEYGENLAPIITLNMHHKLWLSLMRTVIPGMAESLRNKLSEVCDSVLKEMIMWEVEE
tara:strand:- start:547 stop:771 length:225 start_codon:yes stop_codon:yes gene_type:complete